jgi:hypothetical protein
MSNSQISPKSGSQSGSTSGSTSSAPPPKMESAIAARVAEYFCLPGFFCGRRQCRRRGRCGWIFPSTGEPCCLRNLLPKERQIFDELYEKVRRVRSYLGYNELTYTSPYASRRELEDAAVALAQRFVPACDRRRWNDARRARDKEPPPTC